jgi:endonuclease YncB( thermonuclease family)
MTLRRAGVLALMLTASGSGACDQDASPLRFTVPNQEVCGNPAMESQLWVGVTGTVKEVVAPTTLRISVMEPTPHVLTVTLMGLREPGDKKAASEAIAYLRAATEGQVIEVLLDPFDRYFAHHRSSRVEGWVERVSTAMIQSGMVAYEPPKPYRMSHYDACQLRLAEDAAKKARVGIREHLGDAPR